MYHSMSTDNKVASRCNKNLKIWLWSECDLMIIHSFMTIPARCQSQKECRVCARTFANKSNLNRHNASVHKKNNKDYRRTTRRLWLRATIWRRYRNTNFTYTHSTQFCGISYYIWLKQSNYQPDNSYLDENRARYVDDYDVDVTVSYRIFSLIWE